MVTAAGYKGPSMFASIAVPRAALLLTPKPSQAKEKKIVIYSVPPTPKADNEG